MGGSLYCSNIEQARLGKAAIPSLNTSPGCSKEVLGCFHPTRQARVTLLISCASVVDKNVHCMVSMFKCIKIQYKNEIKGAYAVLCTRVHKGGFRAHTEGEWSSRCIKELVQLVRPAWAAPPITKLIRNQKTTVRYTICASGA
jgi:hypothetical protein